MHVYEQKCITFSSINKYLCSSASFHYNKFLRQFIKIYLLLVIVQKIQSTAPWPCCFGSVVRPYGEGLKTFYKVSAPERSAPTPNTAAG